MTLRTPSRTTLRKYGLSVEEWTAIAQRQSYVCGICFKVPKSGILHIEHEHVRGWRQMKPERRKEYVRGLACWFCNSHLLRRGCTVPKLRAAADFLEAYDRRKGGA